jgi:hypothetical protein
MEGGVKKQLRKVLTLLHRAVFERIPWRGKSGVVLGPDFKLFLIEPKYRDPD